jgi:hypothetical protein
MPFETTAKISAFPFKWNRMRFHLNASRPRA